MAGSLSSRHAFPLKLALASIAGLLLCGCATSSIRFTGEKEAKLTVLGGDLKDVIGLRDRPLPQDIVQSELASRFVRIDVPSESPRYFYFMPSDAKDAEIKILKGNGTNDGFTPQTEVSNQTMRLFMSAYQALAQRRWQVARELAGKLVEMQPQLAAPHIVQGIALTQEGQKQEAQAAFTKAKALDPEDAAIDQLLQSIK